ncbi:MAG: GH25 family lysozyme [Bacteroidota bacterium]
MQIDPTKLGHILISIRWPLIILAAIILLGLVWLAIRNWKKGRIKSREAAKQYALRIQLQHDLSSYADRYEEAAKNTKTEIAKYKPGEGDQQKYPALKSEPNPAIGQFIEQGLHRYAHLLSNEKAPRMIKLAHKMGEEVSLDKHKMHQFLDRFPGEYEQIRQAFFNQMGMLSRVYDEIVRFTQYRAVKPEAAEWVKGYRQIFQEWVKKGRDKSPHTIDKQLIEPVLVLNAHHPGQGFVGKTQPLAEGAKVLLARLDTLDTEWVKHAKDHAWLQRKCARVLRHVSVLDSTLCAPAGWRTHLPRELTPDLAAKIGQPKTSLRQHITRWAPVLLSLVFVGGILWMASKATLGPASPVNASADPVPENELDNKQIDTSSQTGHSIPSVPDSSRLHSIADHKSKATSSGQGSSLGPDSMPRYGIDISHHQTQIDWQRLVSDSIEHGKVEFALIRATYGTKADELFGEYWSDAKEAGIIRGAYMYYRFKEDPVAQANYFIKQLGSLEPGDLIPIVDVESNNSNSATDTSPLSRDELRSKLHQLLDILEDHYGVKPMIYTNYKYFYREILADQFPGYTFWLARYDGKTHDDARFDRVLPTEPDEEAVIWQFSETGQLNGIEGDVDLNVMHSGDLDKITIQ